MNMLRAGLAGVVLFLVACGVSEEPQTADVASEAEDPAEFARAVIADFGPQLKLALQQAMAEGGPVAGVNVCHEKAGAIATAIGERHGVRVSRTSMKVRNPANRPDTWQQKTLGQFAASLADGQHPGSLAAMRSTTTNGVTRHRFMRPIIAEPLCLTCHGQALSADIEETLDALYPQDEARGYQAGDLRGAFLVEWEESEGS